MNLFRNLVIRSLLPLTWRRSPRWLAAGLQQFSVTEMDSAWQILHAMREVSDPVTRAKMFQHALEEVHHSAEFDRVSKQFTPVPPPKMRPVRIPIYDEEAGSSAMVDFLAFAHVGESDVFYQFSSYAAAIGNDRASEVFEEAKRDERGHASLTLALLRDVAPNKSTVRRVVLRMRWKRAYESWLRFSSHIGEFTSAILLGAMYLFFAPFVTPVCRRLLGRNESFHNRSGVAT